MVAPLLPCKSFVDRLAQCISAQRCQHNSIDEYRRRRFDSVKFTVFYVAANVRGEFCAFEIGIEAFSIETDLRRILFQRFHIQRALIFEKKIDVLPELALCVCRGGRFGSVECVYVQRRERKTTKLEVNAVAITFHNVFDDRIHRDTRGTLNVRKLDDPCGRIYVSAYRTL